MHATYYRPGGVARDLPSKMPTYEKSSLKDKKELEELPERIASLESQQARFHEQMADPEFFKQDPTTIASANEELLTLTDQLTTAYARWEQLEEIAGQQNGS